ncbi:hypothetical protein J2X46_002288 [Nocardioides sp. BE266]|uniref:hypothetical protein n=1 Tax=Nocardioides sp. BE266 TaxID=2817725 RepID=UPI002861952F|nr:hypothetical protein [Nocardioides sp. BE266]MDR7253303.1 hypothetical protein [Nocardioides sp. BE266]
MMSPLTRPLGLLVALLTLVLAHGSPAQAGLASGDSADSDPDPTWGWETVFYDGFDGPAGVWPEQWHNMLFTNGAAQNGLGQLEVGHLSQIRTNTGWTLPAGTEVRVTAALLMPDTGSNYAAFWVQHPNGIDPREVDVIESYGPLKPAGAQLATHICYDDQPETAINACASTGRPPETIPVTQTFPAGSEPWSTFWRYSADFTIGGDTVQFSASDTAGNRPYDISSTPDARRVPGNAAPFQLRLSNKDVLPQYAVPGGTRQSMLVDWVTVEVKYP